jgi:very-short-patch-repair endonuclease
VSEAETLLAVQLEQAGIDFHREFEFHPSRKWRADFTIEPILPARVLVEVEGGAWTGGRHVTGSGFNKDLEKYNTAAELGYTVLRFSTAMVNDGSALAQIQRVLASKEESNAA